MDKLIKEILTELDSAESKFPSYHSAHEGYAVILEELDELWDEIKKRKQDVKKMKSEAVQVASTAIRFIKDIC